MSLVSKSTRRSSGFDPRQFGNCLLWLDGADTTVFTLSGANVTQWRDRSSNAYVFVPDGSSPQRVTNGVSFNGTTQALRSNPGLSATLTGNSPVTGGETICIVGTFTGTTSRSYCMLGPDRYTGGTGAGTRSFEVVRTTSNVIQWARYGTGTVGAQTGPITSNVQFLVTGRNTGGVGTTRLNGTASATTATTSYAYSPGSLTYIGARYNVPTATADLFYQGTLNEIIVYNWINSNDLQAVEGYLAWKWGLTANLPAGHLYKSAPPFTIQLSPITHSGVSSVCYYWYDSADRNSFVLSGTNVTTWSNKVGTANSHLITGVSPTWTSNGVVFDGTTQFLRAPSVTQNSLTGAVYYFVVTPTGSTNRYYALLGGFSNTGGNSFGITRVSASSNTVSWYQAGALQGQQQNAGAISNVRFLIRSFTTSNTVTLEKGTNVQFDGSAAIIATSAATGLTSSAGSLFVGAHSSDNNGTPSLFFQGTIHEIICISNYGVVGGSLTDTVYQTYNSLAVEGYLATKWGVTQRTPAAHISRITPYPGRIALR